MAERVPNFRFSEKKHVHGIEVGAFRLELYRLFCMFSAGREVTKHGVGWSTIELLEEAYLEPEVMRILISCAAGLRIHFDQSEQKAMAIENVSDCGKVFPNWKLSVKNVEVLRLREACNKIIHATDIRFDMEMSKAGRNRPYYRPFIVLYGKKGQRNWRAELSIIDFVKWGAATFFGWLPPEIKIAKGLTER